MKQQNNQHATDDELASHRLMKYQGIDVGLDGADPMVGIAKKLEAQYPNHLVLVQAGKFLHAFDRSAHALATLKSYQLKLVGTVEDPHLRVGCPAGNFKRRLWSMVDEFGIPYVVALGTLVAGHTVYVSDPAGTQSTVLSSVTPDIVAQVIEDLRTRGKLNQVAARQVLANPDTSTFKLKEQARALDTQLLHDIIKMPRDLRVTYGENLRSCMARLMRTIFAFGLDINRTAALASMSADVDLLKHYLAQAPRLSNLKFSFEHRVGLTVELGRLLGGLIRSDKAAS